MFASLRSNALFAACFLRGRARFSAITSPAKLNHIKLTSKRPTLQNLVVIHGMLGSSANFKGICSNPKINNEANVYLIDLRNHGKSERRDSMTIDEMANDVVQFIRSIHLENIAILGHSLGGRVATQTVLHEHNIARGLMLVDIAPRPVQSAGDPLTLTAQQEKFRQDLERLYELPISGRRLEVVYEEILKIVESKVIANFFVGNLALSQEKIVQGWVINFPVVKQAFLSMITTQYEGQWNGLVRIISGNLSDYVSPQSLSLLKDIFPRFDPKKDSIRVDDAGHWVHFDKPYVFIDEVARFLQDLKAN